MCTNQGSEGNSYNQKRKDRLSARVPSLPRVCNCSHRVTLRCETGHCFSRLGAWAPTTGPRRRRSCSEGNKGVPNAAPRRRRAEQEDGCQWWSVFRALRRLASGRASFRPCQPAWRCARTSMDHRAAVQQRPFPSRAAAVRKSAAPEQRRRVPLLRCAGWCPADPAVKNHLSRR